MSELIKIFDTTLRDGEQSPGCSMSLGEKIEVAQQLEKLRVDVIEAGFPVASPTDMSSVKAISEIIRDASVCALARATAGDIDAAWEGVKKAVSPRIHVFIATSDVHMKYKLQMTPDEVLTAIASSVRRAGSYTSDVEFSAEDACRSDRNFLLRAVETALSSGATVINLPDTVGYFTPGEMFDLIRFIKENAKGIEKAELSVHCHDDLGMAVANSLSGVLAGATQIECSLNGIGERAGNAALEEVVMALHTRQAFFNAATNINTRQIYRASRLIQSITGFPIPPNKSVTGSNAFAHESGIHQHGVMAERSTYEIMSPSLVGIPENIMILGKHSGRHAFENRAELLGYKLSPEELNAAFKKFKVLADKKKMVTDRDIEALLGSGREEYQGKYKLEKFVINSGNMISATAIISLSVDGKTEEEVAIGEGPVDAAFKAINKIAGCDFALEDYSLRSVTAGEDALGEAVVKMKRGDSPSVTGRGLSTDIIEASIKAYLNGVNKFFSAND